MSDDIPLSYNDRTESRPDTTGTSRRGGRARSVARPNLSGMSLRPTRRRFARFAFGLIRGTSHAQAVPSVTRSAQAVSAGSSSAKATGSTIVTAFGVSAGTSHAEANATSQRSAFAQADGVGALAGSPLVTRSAIGRSAGFALIWGAPVVYEGSIGLIDGGDSYSAYTNRPGTPGTVSIPGFDGCTFVGVPGGQVGSGNVYALGANFTDGFTGAGVSADRFATRSIGLRSYHYAIGGTKSSDWRPGTTNHNHVKAALSTERSPVVAISLGGNNVLNDIPGSRTSPLTSSTWTDNVNEVRTDLMDIVGDWVTQRPDVEIILNGYPKLCVVDDDSPYFGVPQHYPPTANNQAIHRAIFITSGYGFYSQWSADSDARIAVWALAKATVDRNAYVAGLGAHPEWFGSPPNYGYDLNSRRGYYTSVQQQAIANDILNHTYNARGNDSLYWSEATKNVTDEIVNQYMWCPLDQAYLDVGAAFPTNVLYVPAWDLFGKGPGKTNTYSGAPKSVFSDFVHLTASSTVTYADNFIDAWLAWTRHTVPGSAARAAL